MEPFRYDIWVEAYPGNPVQWRAKNLSDGGYYEGRCSRPEQAHGQAEEVERRELRALYLADPTGGLGWD